MSVSVPKTIAPYSGLPVTDWLEMARQDYHEHRSDCPIAKAQRWGKLPSGDDPTCRCANGGGHRNLADSATCENFAECGHVEAGPGAHARMTHHIRTCKTAPRKVRLAFATLDNTKPGRWQRARGMVADGWGRE